MGSMGSTASLRDCTACLRHIWNPCLPACHPAQRAHASPPFAAALPPRELCGRWPPLAAGRPPGRQQRAGLPPAEPAERVAEREVCWCALAKHRPDASLMVFVRNERAHSTSPERHCSSTARRVPARRQRASRAAGTHQQHRGLGGLLGGLLQQCGPDSSDGSREARQASDTEHQGNSTGQLIAPSIL